MLDQLVDRARGLGSLTQEPNLDFADTLVPEICWWLDIRYQLEADPDPI